MSSANHLTLITGLGLGLSATPQYSDCFLAAPELLGPLSETIIGWDKGSVVS